MRNLLLFLISACLTLALIDRLLPPIERPSLRVKLERFAQEKDEYTALVVGSSQSFRGFDPARFDERLRAEGVRSKSFNLALPGAQMAETWEHLRRVAELQPEGLRWVFVECDQVASLSSAGRYLTQKNLAWRNWESTQLLWQYVHDLDQVPVAIRSGAYWRSFVGLSYHSLGVGRGVPWIEAGLGVGPTELDRRKWLGPRADGHQCLDDSPNEKMRARRIWTEEQRRAAAEGIRRRLEQRDRGEAVPSAETFFERIVEVVESMGAKAVFFTYCGDTIRNELLALERAHHRYHVLRFDDPERYPRLFDVDYRFDGLHFDRAGARIFTDHFADQVVAGLRRQTQ